MLVTGSSTTSWPTSPSSCTSDPRPDPGIPGAWSDRAARLRLVHPFPSFLNGVVTLAFGLFAGAPWVTAARLGLAMTAFQFSIGALNDLQDASIDAGRTPLKPVAAGLVSRRTATLVAVVAALAGLGLTLPSGAGAVGIAATGLACGYAYDLRLSRTAWSWLPLAVALPLVPVFAWVGAIGMVPAAISAIVPAAVLAGAGLAIGNALVDQGGPGGSAATVADRLGPRRAWVLHSVVLTGAIGWAIGQRASPVPEVGTAVMALGIGLAVAGMVGLLAFSGRWRRLAWQVEALGVAAVGVAFVLALGGHS